MKIKDGLDLPGWKTVIPDCGRDDLPKFFMEMGYKVGVEVGVWLGYFSKRLVDAGLKVYGVDPYVYYDECEPYGSQSLIDNAYKKAKKRLGGNKNFTFIKKFSMEAAKDFEDGSLDFVYIDANHDFKYVTEDIAEWSKKVRKGGVISGHDYIYIKNAKPGYLDVKYVVNAWTMAKKIPKWYVLGRRHKRKGEKRDRFRSWFWIKS